MDYQWKGWGGLRSNLGEHQDQLKTCLNIREETMDSLLTTNSQGGIKVIGKHLKETILEYSGDPVMC